MLTNTKQKFKADLTRGNILEDFVADYFTSRGWTVERTEGYNPSHDLRITRDRSSFLLEIKHDVLSDKTQNYALEEKALTHSKSDILVIGTPNELYYLPMQTARELLARYPKIQAGDLPNNLPH
jgi:hypothetical protein